MSVVKFEKKKKNPKIKFSRKTATIGFVSVFIGFIVLTILVPKPLYEYSQIWTYTSSRGDHVVEAQMNRSGHYIVKGNINGFEVDFIVDTGASAISIPIQVAKRIGLEFGEEFQARTAGGLSTSYETELSEVSVGKIKKSNLWASISSRSDDDLILLGMNFLHDLELEQKKGMLILKQNGR